MSLQTEDEVLERFGYRQQFVRSLRHFESFAVAFSFISITTGIFTTYAFALAVGGTRAIWTWLIVIAGQALVALVYGALSVRVPLSGYSYQWASRLANTGVGWWFGWMSFAFLTIVTVSVDYGLVQVAFQPLIGETFSPTSAALETLVVLALQDKLAYGPTFESAMAALFGGAVSSLSAAAVPAEPVRGAPASAASSQAAADASLNALIAEAAKDLADYQRLTAEGKLGEAGQKLEELKRTIDKLNTRQR